MKTEKNDLPEGEEVIELFPEEKREKKTASKRKKAKSLRSVKKKAVKKEHRPKQTQSWKLKKTLSRQVDVNLIEEKDLRHIYAAYRLGSLSDLGSKFSTVDLSPKDFKRVFIDHVLSEYSYLNGNDTISLAWSIKANFKNRFRPVANAYGVFHPLSHTVIVVGIIWFPWATVRNKVEGIVKFFNETRKDIKMIWYTRPEHKALYEVVMKHGIVRRVGTSHSIFADVPATIYETIS